PAQAPALAPAGAAPASTQAVSQGAANPANDGGNGATAWEYEPVWVETNECTACDECLEIAPGVFAYDDNKQAVVVNPKGGSYKDIVRAAEKCAALAVHPGTPANAQEPDAEKLMKRAAKFN
ncbi:ferredoxin, partial [Ectothiorhodospira haloalkaliphila]